MTNEKRENFMRKTSFFLVVLMIINCLWSTGVLQVRAEGPEELDEDTLEYLAYMNDDLQTIIDDGEIMAVLYKTNSYAAKADADLDAPAVATLYSGQTVFVRGVTMDADYNYWIKAAFYSGEELKTGYIEYDYLLCTDERYKEFEMMYGLNMSMISLFSLLEFEEGEEGEDQGIVSSFDEVNEFPESYREALDALKEAHPNWHFTPMITNLDWKTTIDNEIGAKSLVYYTFEDWTKDGLYDEHNWYYATREILEYYMDPRNALTEKRIFQFEQLTYNESYHTQEALEKFLEGTFMAAGKKMPAPNDMLEYPFILFAIAKEDIRRVSPFHLAARIIQEQGRDGNGDLISGVYPGFEGYYNYFNIGASGMSHEEVVRNGLTYAKNAKDRQGRPFPWDSPYAALMGGADKITLDYIQKGQDTLYLQKYNVNPNGPYRTYSHQYMQNISAPTTESMNIYSQYDKAGALDMEFNFKIPVYLDMPEEAVAYPTIEESLCLKIPEGYDDTKVYVDGIAYTTGEKYGFKTVDVPGSEAKSAVVYKYNESGVPVGMYVWELSVSKNRYKATALPTLENMLSYHGFSIRITGKAGIRFKSGIKEEIKNLLIDSQADGYTLEEYGTLVMNNANRETYPMILNGEKVLKGLSYGTENGEPVDKIYENVGGVQRFTSVLVGLPASQYQVEYAFRSYAILKKGEKRITVYGPVLAKSIYSLADVVLQNNTYSEGSDAHSFLVQLKSDADAYAAQQEAERLEREQAEREQAEREEAEREAQGENSNPDGESGNPNGEQGE